MKKTIYLFTTVLFSYLLVMLLTGYSDYIYDILYDGKEELVVDMKENQDNEDFINSICFYANQTNVDFFYTRIENASSLKPIVKVYTTSINSNFLELKNNYPYVALKDDDYLTTTHDSGSNIYRLYARNSYYDYELHDIGKIKNFQLQHCKLYTSSDNEEFISLLKNNGYTITVYESNTTNEDMNDYYVLAALIVFATLSYLFYCHTRSREIAVKKAYGYSSFNVFTTTFLKPMINISLTCVITSLAAFIIYACIWGMGDLFYFIIYASKDLLIYLTIITCIFFASCIYTAVIVDPSDIRGIKPMKFLTYFSYAGRVIASILIIYNLTNVYNFICYSSTLHKAYNSIDDSMLDMTTITLNTKSTDLESDIHSSLAYDFIVDVFSNYDALVIDPSEIDEHVLYVTKGYLSYNPIYSVDGTQITEDSITDAGSSTVILLPEGYSPKPHTHDEEHETEEDDEDYSETDFDSRGIYLEDDNIKVIYYKAGQRFRTVSPFYPENEGTAVDPGVIFLNSENMPYEALQILGSQYLYIPCKSDDPLNELMPLIKKNNLDSVILETQTLDEEYQVIFFNIKIALVQYIAFGIIYIIQLITITLFESIAYYEQNKRKLSILILNGYSYHAHIPMIILKTVTCILLLFASAAFHYNIVPAVFVCVLDAVIFIWFIKSFEIKELPVYLKGDL